MKRALLLFTIVVSCVSQELYAQKVAVKTNLLSDAFFSPNLGVEVGFAPRWTLDVSGQAVEALGSAAGSSLLAMRPLRRTLFRCAFTWRTVQHRRIRRENQYVGH